MARVKAEHDYGEMMKTEIKTQKDGGLKGLPSLPKNKMVMLTWRSVVKKHEM